ncbi:caldesmon-like [Portunus trituberculatus]|uniref:caldesmon-like n=1 Tax=Portunus trituberculatus TaxID=210409 RepID=UPI001E1CD171|nr:caldesmon-like [Portunus trituberculatus]
MSPSLYLALVPVNKCVIAREILSHGPPRRSLRNGNARLQTEQLNKTGGGPAPPPLDTIDEIVEDVLGEGNKIDDIILHKVKHIEEERAEGESHLLEEPQTTLSTPTHEDVEAAEVPLHTVSDIYAHVQEVATAPAVAAVLEELAAAARAAKLAAEEVSSCAWAVGGAVRAQEEFAREAAKAEREKAEAAREEAKAARENAEAAREKAEAAREEVKAAKENAEAAREKAEASRLKQLYLKIKIENAKRYKQ